MAGRRIARGIETQGGLTPRLLFREKDVRFERRKYRRSNLLQRRTVIQAILGGTVRVEANYGAFIGAESAHA